MPNAAQTTGVLVGKMGITTGWTEGSIIGSINWYGTTAMVTNYWSSGGDSGGPVWRYDGAGLRAVGMHVGSVLDQNKKRIGAAYIPINTLLDQWGATLPVFAKTLTFASEDAPSDSIDSGGGTLDDATALSPDVVDVCPGNDCVLVNE
ncbi:hypothetical protein IF188_00205 [Microbacterium sp. NEAU-LLC]|uniref:Serine protease n=2 Tax=Microbacterium helvum TaxID=2773713 RepID=A0ABR8NIF8_9MICO|nr:hypothetical protein [Microbacterium helvum]